MATDAIQYTIRQMAVNGRADDDPGDKNYRGNYTTSVNAKDKNEYAGGWMHSKRGTRHVEWGR